MIRYFYEVIWNQYYVFYVQERQSISWESQTKDALSANKLLIILLSYHVCMISGGFLVVSYSWNIKKTSNHTIFMWDWEEWGLRSSCFWSLVLWCTTKPPLCHISAFNQTCQIKFINNKTSLSFCYQNAFLQEVKQTSATMFEMQWTAIWRRKSLQRKHKNNFEGKEEEKQPNKEKFPNHTILK